MSLLPPRHSKRLLRQVLKGPALKCTGSQFEDGTSLKIDFVHRYFDELEPGKKYKNLQIASLWDIVVDKLYTLVGRLTARDFVDLYFGMKAVDCSLDQVMNALEEKYETRFNKFDLMSRLPSATDVTGYPTMLIPFDKNKMEKFYLRLAKSLEDKIFE